MAQALSVFVNIGAKLLPSLNSSASSIERRFGMMNKRLRIQAAETKLAFREMSAASSGLLGLAAAGGLTMGLSKAIGQGSNLAHEMQMLRNAGLSSREFADSMQAAFATAKVLPTSTWEDNLKVIKETRGAFGDLHHALENLTFNQKLGAQLSNMLKIDPSEASHSIATAVQALEIRGSAMDIGRYQREMGLAYKAMVQTGGRFNADELKAFSGTANIPIKGYSERFLFSIIPSIITELGGGDVAGTQAAAFRNQILGRVGVGGQKLTDEWVRLGLVPKSGTGGNFSKTGWTAGTMKGHDLAMRDPFQWAESVLIPAMQKGGVDTKSTAAVALEMSKLFGRETAVRFATMLVDPLQRKRLHKDEAMMAGAFDLDKAYAATLKGDPLAGWGAIKSQTANLGAAIFGPDAAGNASVVATSMVNIAKGINWIAETIKGSPSLKMGIGGLFVGASGLAGLTLFGVTLKWLAAPFRWFIGGLRWLAGSRIGGIAANAFIRLGGALRSLGPVMWAGARALGPWLLRGVAAAFGYLSNPVGWAILAASAALLVWRYREEIARAWHSLTSWFTNTAWPAIKSTVMSVDWAAVGSSIVDGMTFGLASKLPNMLSTVHRFLKSEVGFNMKDGLTLTPPPAVAGARASGGPISSGRAWLVGEQGPELVVPHRSGTVIPAAATAAMLAKAPRGGGNTWQVTVNVNGARDPAEVGREVERALERLARRQESLLTD